MALVILSGWKRISRRLGCGSAPPSQHQGLPVKRISNGPRRPVVPDSELLDGWMLRGAVIPDGAPPDLLRNLQRARELQREVKRNRKELQLRLETLRKEMAEFRAKRRR